MLHRWVRETAFRAARRDVAAFLVDHEADLLVIFREEMQRLDDELPEEQSFIDIKMVPIGEMLLKAVLRSMHRFLTEGVTEAEVAELAANVERLEESAKHL